MQVRKAVSVSIDKQFQTLSFLLTHLNARMQTICVSVCASIFHCCNMWLDVFFKKGQMLQELIK